MKILIEHKEELRERFKVKKSAFSALTLEGEQKKRGSDSDVLVEFEEPIGLFEFMDLEEYLSNLLTIKVDLVLKKALKPQVVLSLLLLP
ncbi:MAG: nucleotidyltransferase domain-containing protein [Candidatus Bathyarchaeia archaeon]